MSRLYPAETTSGVVTSFIPLTTTYTPTPSCSRIYRLDGPSLVAFDPGYGFDIDTKVDCEPSAVTTWWEQGRFGGGGVSGHTAVSIGPLVCPDGWPTVATSVRSESSTLAMCCPSGYSLANGVPGSIGGDCLSGVAKGATLTYASTSYGDSVWSTATTTLAASSSVGAIAVVGWNVNSMSQLSSVVLSSATLLQTSTASSSASSSSTTGPVPGETTSSSSTDIPPSITSAAPTTTIPPPPSSSTISAPSSGSDHISKAAMAGIGVGAAFGAIGIAALLVAAALMRRNRKKEQANAALMQEASSLPPGQQQPWQAYELYSETRKAELEDNRAMRPELPAGRVDIVRSPAELYG